MAREAHKNGRMPTVPLALEFEGGKMYYNTHACGILSKRLCFGDICDKRDIAGETVKGEEKC